MANNMKLKNHLEVPKLKESETLHRPLLNLKEKVKKEYLQNAADIYN